MIWPAAALALILIGFAVVYGSVVESRLDAHRDPDDTGRTR